MNKSFTTFIEEYQASEGTKRVYGIALGEFDKFLAGAEPTERKVEEFMLSIEKKGLSSASVNLYLSAIRAYFLWRKKHAPPEKRGYWDLMVKGPKVHNKLPREFPAEDVQRMVKACETSLELALVTTLYDGALRIKELQGLQVDDVDYNQKQLRITGKGGDEAVVPVGDKTLQALKEYIGKRQGQIFTQDYWTLSRTLKKVGNRAKVRNVHPHQLRHARAQNMRDHGVAVEDAKDFFRHKNIETTLRYFRGNTTKLRARINKAF